MSKQPESPLAPSIFARLRFWQKPISLFYFNLLLALWLGLVLNYGFYEKIQQFTPYQGIKAIGLLIATVIVIVSAYHLLLQ